MHLLVLTDGFPYPLTSGRLRQHHFIHELGRRHRITLLSAVAPDHPPEHARAFALDVERVETVVSDRLRPGLPAKLHSRLRREPADAAMQARILDLHGTDPFDLVLNARLPLPLRTLLPGVPIVTDICDTVSDALVARLRFAPPWETPVLLAKHHDARRDEDRMAAESDHLLFASVRDRDTFATRSPAMPASTVVPNGVDLDAWQRRTPRLGRDTVVFAGAMPYAPNEDAAIFLIEQVMPRVWAERPTARLRIVGRDPRARLVTAARNAPNVELTGFVPDMREPLDGASVVVAPLRFGMGIQNKILEAMAMEVPVVTTPVAEAGLLRAGDQPPPIAVAAHPDDLAAFAVRRLAAADADGTPDRAARAWISTRFRWDLVGDRLEAILTAART